MQSIRPWIRPGHALVIVVAVLAISGSSAAKDLCLHTTSDGGYTFLLKKASAKAGAFGTASGYAVPDGNADFFVPISGSYVATAAGIGVGITRYAVSVSPNSGAGGSYNTAFHNIDDDTDRAWEITSNGDLVVHDVADVEIVDCSTVPVPPRR